jgi:hypothetical protein
VLAPSRAACRSEETERVRSGDAPGVSERATVAENEISREPRGEGGGRTAGDPSSPSKNRVGTDRASRAVAASATSANAVPRIANTRSALGAHAF